MAIQEIFSLRQRAPEVSQEEQEAKLYQELQQAFNAVSAEHPEISFGGAEKSTINGMLQLIAEYLTHFQTSAQKSKPQTTKRLWWRKNGKQKTIESKTYPPQLLAGTPGTGKTTIMKMVDEALSRLNLPINPSARTLVENGVVKGYFAHQKENQAVTPLPFGESKTGVLTIEDWKRLHTHWVVEKVRMSEDPAARINLLQSLLGKVIFIDEIEKNGHGYLLDFFIKNGFLVFMTSNISDMSNMNDGTNASLLEFNGADRRRGSIEAVCVTRSEYSSIFDLVKEASIHESPENLFKLVKRNGKKIAYASWPEIQNRGFMKAQFSEYFGKHQVDGILLEGVSFLTKFNPQEASGENLLDTLPRFVHLLDAIEHLQLPLLVRTQAIDESCLDLEASSLHATLRGYDAMYNRTQGEIAFIEFERCLSRLRSRQALNAAFFPAFMAKPESFKAPQRKVLSLSEQLAIAMEAEASYDAFAAHVQQDALLARALAYEEFLFGKQLDLS